LAAGRLRIAYSARARFLGEGDNVMDYAAIARSNLHRLDPLVLFEVRRNREVQVWNGPIGWYRVLLSHAEHHVWFTDGPTLGKFRSCRHVFVVALWSPCAYPRHDSVDLFLRKAGIIRELSIVRIRGPGRHRTLDYAFSDRASPGPDFLIGHQRHRSYLPRTVTLDAAIVE